VRTFGLHVCGHRTAIRVLQRLLQRARTSNAIRRLRLRTRRLHEFGDDGLDGPGRAQARERGGHRQAFDLEALAASCGAANERHRPRRHAHRTGDRATNRLIRLAFHSPLAHAHDDICVDPDNDSGRFRARFDDDFDRGRRRCQDACSFADPAALSDGLDSSTSARCRVRNVRKSCFTDSR